MANYIKNFFTRKNMKHIIVSFLLTLLGTFLLALGDGIFLVPFKIVSGGVAGLGIILSEFTGLSVDTWSYIFMWGFFLIGIIFLGLNFSLSTLISTIFFPIFLTIILRTNIATGLINMMINDSMSVHHNGSVIIIEGLENIEAGRLLIMGLIGGVLCGLGCGITFHGGGSTGGTDILSFVLNKYLNISTSVGSFILDGLIVFVGLCISLSHGIGYRFQFFTGIIGILGALMCSLMIEISYSGRSEIYIADIISSKTNEINDFVVKNLERTSTLFKVKGGYRNDDHEMIRICINRREYMSIKNAVAKIDPKAFVMFYNCKTIQGEGFDKLESSNTNTVTQIKNEFIKNKKVNTDSNDKPKQ